MDEMDYEMQHPEEPSTPRAQQLPAAHGCPAWRGEGGPTPPSMPVSHANPSLGIRVSPSDTRRSAAASHFSHIHNANGTWLPQQATNFQWPAPPLAPAPAPAAVPMPFPSRLPLPDPYQLEASGPRPTPSTGPNPPAAFTSGPAQPVLGLPPQPQSPFSHDPFTSYAFFHHPSPAAPPELVHAFAPFQPRQPGMSTHGNERQAQAAGIRSTSGSGSNILHLTPTSQSYPPRPHMSSSAERGVAVPPEAAAPRTSAASAGSSEPSNRSTARSVSAVMPPTTTSPRRSGHHSSHPRPVSLFGGEQMAMFSPTSPAAPPNTERRPVYFTRARGSTAAVQSQISDYDSDEDFEGMEEERDALRLIESFTVGTGGFPVRAADMDEDRIRAHQILRGQLSSKRVASRNALSSLQSVEIANLPESERTCVICYNEFGVPNPEGINEAPLRLPKCKHVFGDHCIKKWFEESDSCPYCRDKVPSEPQLRSNQALREMLRVLTPRGLGPMATGRSASTSFSPTGPSGASDEHIRYVRFERSPPRNWQTGERRSPPSETNDNRRRTRPRYGSFTRGSPPSVAVSNQGIPSGPNSQRPNSFAGVSVSQQSPVRDRVQAPMIPFAWNSEQFGGPRRSLTPHMTRQNPSTHSRSGPYGSRPLPAQLAAYIGLDGHGLRVTATPGQQPGANPPPAAMATPQQQQHHEHRYTDPLSTMAGPPSLPPSGLFPGPANLASFSPHHQPVSPPSDATAFSGVPGHANSQAVSNRDGW